MTERFKPEIRVVRVGTVSKDTWVEEDGLWPKLERAILVRGVPMVGERIEWMVRGDSLDEPWRVKHGTVSGYDIRIVRKDGNTIPVTTCYPAPDEDEALVERVAEVIRRGWGRGMTPEEIAIAKEAIRAMKEGGNG